MSSNSWWYHPFWNRTRLERYTWSCCCCLLKWTWFQYEACYNLDFTECFNYRLAHTFIRCLCNIIHLTASLHENSIGFHYTTFDCQCIILIRTVEIQFGVSFTSQFTEWVQYLHIWQRIKVPWGYELLVNVKEI